MPQEIIHERIVEKIIHVLVPEVMERTVEVGKHIRQEGMQSYSVEQIVGVPFPQTQKESREVTQLIPQERISDRVVEQTAHFSSPQIPQEEERLFSDGTHVVGCTERNAKLNDMRVVRSEVAEVCR